MFSARKDRPGIVPLEKRKVIYTGTDIPSLDPRGPNVLKELDLARQISRLRQLPFDGIAVQIMDPKFEFPRNNLGNNLFSSTRQEYRTFAPVIPQLRALAKTGLTDNFLIIAPGFWFESGKHDKFDWFDDARWSVVENNLRIYFQIARQSGAIRGIILDPEQYHKPAGFGGETEHAYYIFSENIMYNLVNSLPKSTDARGDYRAKVRERGRRFQQIKEEKLPNSPLLLYLGNAPALENRPVDGPTLFPAFLDGILEEIERSGSRSYVIDGWEQAYTYRTEAEYRTARQEIYGRARSLSAVPALYDKHVRVGFGKWLDNTRAGSERGWSATDIGKNYYNPKEWEDSLRLALQNTDEYVWIWTLGEGRVFPMSHNRTVNLPSAYLEATRRARRG